MASILKRYSRLVRHDNMIDNSIHLWQCAVDYRWPAYTYDRAGRFTYYFVFPAYSRRRSSRKFIYASNYVQQRFIVYCVWYGMSKTWKQIEVRVHRRRRSGDIYRRRGAERAVKPRQQTVKEKKKERVCSPDVMSFCAPPEQKKNSQTTPPPPRYWYYFIIIVFSYFEAMNHYYNITDYFSSRRRRRIFVIFLL